MISLRLEELMRFSNLFIVGQWQYYDLRYVYVFQYRGGHTRKKWYSFSTIRKLHLVNSRFLREIFECLPVSISKECADNLNLVKAIFESSICYKV